jgi:hypothetical protein
MNRNKVNPPDIRAFIKRQVDTNNNGIIEGNEFRTLCSLVFGKFSIDDVIIFLSIFLYSY